MIQVQSMGCGKREKREFTALFFIITSLQPGRYPIATHFKILAAPLSGNGYEGREGVMGLGQAWIDG